jgi:type IV secretory pathway VirJ component
LHRLISVVPGRLPGAGARVGSALTAALLAAWLLAGALLAPAAVAAPKPARANSQPLSADVTPLPQNASHLSHGRFKDFVVYAPATAPTSFVLFLSGQAGWNAAAESMAQRLAQQGALVAGLDLPKLQANLDADPAQCVFPDGDLENLSHFVQAYFHNNTYLTPLLIGLDSGATLAYGALAQAPHDTFAGALTVDFCPTSTLQKPLCQGSGLESAPAAHGPGMDYLPIKSLDNPWVTLQTPAAKACEAATSDFVAKVHGAASAALPSLGAASFEAAFAKLAAAAARARVPPPPAALGDLPVVEVPARPGVPQSDEFAILMSGDGGWAGIDQDIAAALTAAGVPVVGLDSLRYYWTARTPEGLAADTDKLIRYYLAHLGKKRVLLIGYSQGADVLPFAVNRLPTATRANVALAAILGMSEHALFEFHVSSWISDSNSGPATLPEVDRITGIPVLCIYGTDEKDSLCPKLDPQKIKVVQVKGGHHFDGNYGALAQQILDAAKH